MNQIDFTCIDCKETKAIQTDGGTGYGQYYDSDPIGPVCYSCCAIRDKADMIATGKATLYLTAIGTNGSNWTDGTVSNWPGTLKLNARVKRGNHNMARYRYDAWFVGPDSKPWHGTQYGENTQLIRCKRIKS